MAEFVQKRLEELLPELEQLERVQLFTKPEVRAVIKKRKEFEYRLQRKRKSLDDYTRYIEYEKNVLQLIWKRRERLGYKHKQADIDHKIVTRICQLYRIATIRFSDNVQLFLSHVDFCRQMKQLAQGSRVFQRLLRTHAHRADVWEAAARYEMEDNNSPETARRLYLRALRLHPESAALWTAHFRMELQYVDVLRQRQSLLGVSEKGAAGEGEDGEGADSDGQDSGGEDGGSGEEEEEDSDEPKRKRRRRSRPGSDPVLQGAVAMVVARQAIARLQEADPKADPCRLLAALLAQCRPFEFAAGLEAQLRAELRDCFPEHALTYDTLAREALSGGRAPGRLRARLEACCAVYEEGLSAAPAADLYPLYVSSLVEAARAAARHRHLVLPRLEAVLERALEAGAATEGALLQAAALYAELGLTERAAAALRAGTERFGASVPLWDQLIQVLAAAGDGDGVCAAFEAAAVAVPDSAAGCGALWLRVLQWAAAHRTTYVERVFGAAAVRSAAVLRPLKAAYLRWLAEQHGLEAARRMFSEHQLRPPVDADLFAAMAELEERQRPVDVARLRDVYRTACRHVGDDRLDLWMAYVRFERERGSPELAAGVYRQAVASLRPEQADQFVAQHAKMVANVVEGDD
ncbi:U3 small nucleolar RNA-associated protein 6 homolog [Amphibalanus amphitrite]|uniref:U3 small nucleolar RNA-associated protein 6 homolog n=1 Tax=Amphibalanus amphitrite TaxID=1232801 RepID=UPI001C91166B|nr:U3 small nucleolar RNA-associated protein 6 homolog [Amphibalanus amphitrite]XP_043239544.1 U3 small nucleolar RNA-associated protein 6 homolog [Amphibalanus amphitrite]XP_043239545.1 U3 small nucleolar RNA-associated protein 6 homolog [Amphibalanus amphitrite]